MSDGQGPQDAPCLLLPGTTGQSRMKRDCTKATQGHPAGFHLAFSSRSVQRFSSSRLFHLTIILTGKKKNYLKFFWLKITIFFSVADLIPSCTCPKVICGVYSPVLFPFLTFLGHFPFPGPSLAPLYPHPRCVVGTTLSLGSQPVAAGSVHPITVRAGLSAPCGCRRSGSRCGGCLCSFGGINGAFASCRDISRFLSSAELA